MARPPTSRTVELACREEACLCVPGHAVGDTWPIQMSCRDIKHTHTGEMRFAHSECPKSFLKSSHLSELSRPTGLRREALAYLWMVEPCLWMDEASLEGCNNAATLSFVTASMEAICPEDIAHIATSGINAIQVEDL